MALRLKASESETNNESTHYQPTTLSVYQIACRAGQHNQPDRIDLSQRSHEHYAEDRPARRVHERIGREKHRAGQSDHRTDHRPHSEHRAFDIQVVLQSEVKPRDHDHQRYGRQADRERSEDRAPDIPRHDIADVGRAVDRDRPRRHLRNGDDIGQFAVRNPLVADHHLVLDQRQHRITAAETEKADLQIG